MNRGLEALGGRSDFARNVLTLNKMGVDVPLTVHGAGHYVLRVASFGKEREKVGEGPTNSVSYFEWDA